MGDRLGYTYLCLYVCMYVAPEGPCAMRKHKAGWLVANSANAMSQTQHSTSFSSF